MDLVVESWAQELGAMEGTEAQSLTGQEHPPRNKLYNLGAYNFEYDGTAPVETGSLPPFARPLPFAPSKQMIFEIYFFRQLYDYLVSRFSRMDLPLVAVRNMSIKLMHTFQLPGALEVNFFGDLKKPFCTWSDIQWELLRKGHPQIRLSLAERIYLTLSHEESSKVAKGWFYFVMLVTVANMTKIMFPEVAAYLCDEVGLDQMRGECSTDFDSFCIMVFSLDYFTKLFCSPFVRMEVVEANVQIFCTEDMVVKPLSSMGRVSHFALQGDAIVDLVAILPWWMEFLVGNLLPGASFLRVIRLARLMRIFKSAKYLDMVQVLGLTLWKSMVMVAYLFILILVISLIAGCLLQQFEKENGEEVFQTVPRAGFWIFSRLISMGDVPNVAGKVQSKSGITVLAGTLTLKGVMWIVPIAHIKKIFTKEYSHVTRERELRMQIRDQVLDMTTGGDHKLLTSPTGVTCGLLWMKLGERRAKAQLPLPIQRSEQITVEDPLEVPLVVAFTDGTAVGEVLVRMTWVPGPEMKEKEALPSGALTVSILKLSLDKGASPESITWEIPIQAFGCVSRVVNLREVSNQRTFQINWNGAAGTADAQRAAGEQKGSREQVQPYALVKDFQAQVLHLLHEQGKQLRSQEELLTQQEDRIKLLSK